MSVSKSNKKLISIVVPVYNLEQYIEECLDSLLEQDIDKEMYEIICVNDGSDDGSGHILDKYKEKYSNVHVIHKENGGVSSTRNAGIESSNGDYIWFVDGDDFITNNVLFGIAHYLKECSPELMFVGVAYYEDGKDNLDPNVVDQFKDWLWARIIKKSIITESKIMFNENVHIAEDHLFCTRLSPYIKKQSIYNEDIIVYHYRKREGSILRTNTDKKIDKLIQATRVFLQYSNDGMINRDIGMREVYKNMTVIMYSMAKMPNKKQRELLKNLRRFGLFPLKINREYQENFEISKNMSFDDKVLLKLKAISYTEFGYRFLRLFRLFLKIKRRII